jgi:F-type H+-transporting ATPase subunit b
MNAITVFAAGAGNNFLTGDLSDTHTLLELVFTGLASIIVFALLWWKAMPFAKKALAGRTARIARELEDAGKTRTDAEGRLGDVQERIANAEDERQRILVEARQTAEALKQQIVARAGQEAEALKVRAASDIESAKQQAIADLQDEVATLVLGAAEAVIARNLDPATQAELIDGYIDQVGTPASAGEGRL